MSEEPKKEQMDESIQIAVVFQTYSVVLNLMNKTLVMLAERGADQRTLTFLVKNINSLIENINEYAGEFALEKNWNVDLDQICSRFNISRAADDRDEHGEAE